MTGLRSGTAFLIRRCKVSIFCSPRLVDPSDRLLGGGGAGGLGNYDDMVPSPPVTFFALVRLWYLDNVCRRGDCPRRMEHENAQRDGSSDHRLRCRGRDRTVCTAGAQTTYRARIILFGIRQ